MKLNINQSKELSKAIDNSLHDMKIEKVDKKMIPALFFSTALEHYRSILILIENKRYGSAGSLLRCLFESYVKGLWFHECASEADYKEIRRDKFERKFYLLVNDLEKVESRGLAEAKRNYWSVLNSLTHTGLHQLARRTDGENLTSNYDEEFIADILRMATTYGFLSCSAVAIVSGDAKTLEKVAVLSEKYNS